MTIEPSRLNDPVRRLIETNKPIWINEAVEGLSAPLSPWASPA